MTLVAIIPARAGSKGIPHKNIRPLGGVPLIAWTIAAARSASVFDRIIVSTDGEHIAAVAKEYGAEALIRPPELATDDALPKAAVRHMVEALRAEGATPQHVCYLQPTSPLRRGEDILATITLVLERQFESAASFTPVNPHPERAFRVTGEGEATPVLDHDHVWRNRQGRAPQYHLNGAVYFSATDLLLSDAEPRMLHGRIGAHLMPPEKSIDIDTPLDLQICEALLVGMPRPLPVA